ncbi:DUF2156 domain-containing protein [Deinococcus sp. KSM4-11]|uniref:phosphatidylglycerol lysyltransferase domain-containing protein n=1 Tax=Deinococcus sp. KSM4-11 TaxID=2568654 RepID=UPI0010A3B52B|nr:phosphatidylglycerol lysyltransferase domain-containing protein [Deinococcus sp. KSM4-11]THF87026.1 DUF2156 domain-containing protein [Deinococcus sp. KSM4-11]
MTSPSHLPAVQRALRYHARHARNPSSLVAIDRRTHLFEHPAFAGGVPYLAVGPVWMAGEPLAPPDAVPGLLTAFLDAARRARRTAILSPVGPDVGEAARQLGLPCLHLGATAYVDAHRWAPRGNRFARLRNDLNHAARQGLHVREVVEAGPGLQRALERLARRWLAGRRAGAGLEWIFRLDPSQHALLKRTFIASGPDGTLLAFLSASPLPGRAGWYLEDVVRDERSPRGTAASVVAHAIRTLGAEGVRSVTLGGVPLTGTSGDLHLRFLKPLVSRWYHVDGLQHFKAQFGADHVEDEWMILPSRSALPLAAWAVLRLALPDGVRPLMEQLWGDRPARSRRPGTPAAARLQPATRP